MTHVEAFELLEVLNKHLPIDPATKNTRRIRRAIRAAALTCAYPATYTILQARENMELGKKQ